MTTGPQLQNTAPRRSSASSDGWTQSVAAPRRTQAEADVANAANVGFLQFLELSAGRPNEIPLPGQTVPSVSVSTLGESHARVSGTTAGNWSSSALLIGRQQPNGIPLESSRRADAYGTTLRLGRAPSVVSPTDSKRDSQTITVASRVGRATAAGRNSHLARDRNIHPDNHLASALSDDPTGASRTLNGAREASGLVFGRAESPIRSWKADPAKLAIENPADIHSGRAVRSGSSQDTGSSQDVGSFHPTGSSFDAQDTVSSSHPGSDAKGNAEPSLRGVLLSESESTLVADRVDEGERGRQRGTTNERGLSDTAPSIPAEGRAVAITDESRLLASEQDSSGSVNLRDSMQAASEDESPPVTGHISEDRVNGHCGRRQAKSELSPRGEVQRGEAGQGSAGRNATGITIAREAMGHGARVVVGLRSLPLEPALASGWGHEAAGTHPAGQEQAPLSTGGTPQEADGPYGMTLRLRANAATSAYTATFEGADGDRSAIANPSRSLSAAHAIRDGVLANGARGSATQAGNAAQPGATGPTDSAMHAAARNYAEGGQSGRVDGGWISGGAMPSSIGGALQTGDRRTLPIGGSTGGSRTGEASARRAAHETSAAKPMPWEASADGELSALRTNAFTRFSGAVGVKEAAGSDVSAGNWAAHAAHGTAGAGAIAVGGLIPGATGTGTGIMAGSSVAASAGKESASLHATSRGAGAPADAQTPDASISRSILVKLPAELRGEAVQLRFLQRGGQIDVRVASQSEAAARELREHLPQLMTRLQEAGFSTDSIRGLERGPNSEEAGRRSAFAEEQRNQQEEQGGANRESSRERNEGGDTHPDRTWAVRRGTGRGSSYQMGTSDPQESPMAFAQQAGARYAENAIEQEMRRYR